MRKSRREKEQEAAEARRREEEERAARAYAEFVDAFEGDGAKPKAGGGFVRAGAETGVAYAPQQSKPAREATSRTSAMFERDDEVSYISHGCRNAEIKGPLPPGGAHIRPEERETSYGCIFG